VTTMSSSSEEVTHSESESSDAGESGDENDARATRGSLDVVGHAATTTARASPPAFRALESFSSDKKDPPARHPKRRKTRRKKLDALGVCLVNCKYPLLRDVTSKLGYREVGEEEDWCLYWTDTSVAIERVMRLKPLQKINHFTGMLEICRKKALARNLRRVAAKLPASFDFAPQSFVLPEELEAFSDAVKGNRASAARKGEISGKKKKSAKSRATTFILKPDAGCQGKGITLVQTEAQAQTALRDLGVIGPETGTNKSGFANVQKTASVVAQKYVSDPFLIDGRKFDLRVYVLVTCADPLRVFVYDDGLVRFCTNAYEAPDAKNLHDACMHLTNYAVNKNSENFVRAEDVDKAARQSRNVFESATRTPAERARALLREEARYPSGLGDKSSSETDDTSDDTRETSPRAETEPVSRPVGDGGLASKWSVRGGLKPWMRRNGFDFDRVWASVIDVCVKTVIAAAPTLRHNYRNAMRQMDRGATTTASQDEDGRADDSVAPNENVDPSRADASASSCFELLGVDVMLDKKLKCWLVEVNHSPSFATDSELDRDVKESLITDTLRLVRLDSKAMKKHRLREQTSARERLGVEDAEVRGDGNQKEKALGNHSSTFRLAKPKKKKATSYSSAGTNRQRRIDSGAYRLAFPSEDDFVAQASYEEALRVATEAFETHGAHARARDAMRRAAESSRRKLAESRVKALFHERGAALPAGERFRKAVDRAMRHRERTGLDADWETVHPKKRGFLTSGKRRSSSRGSSRSASRQGSAEGRARGAASAASAARRGGASGGETSGDATSSDDDDDDYDDYGTRGILRIAKAGGLAASLARDSLMRGAVRRDPPRPRPAPRSVVDLQGDAIRRLMESRAAEARASLATAEAKAKLGRLSLGGTRDAREAVRRFESFLDDASGENVDAASGSRPIGRGSHLRNSSGVFGTSSFAGGAHSLQTKRPPRRDPRAERAAPERAGAGEGAGRLGLGMGLVGEKLATAG